MFKYSSSPSLSEFKVNEHSLTPAFIKVHGIVYNGTTASNGAISFIQTEEGRAVPQSGTWHYEYNLMDHLGNVRLSFDKDPTAGTARRIQEDEYYAFGLRSPFYNLSNNNRYLYNGKEVQTDLTSQYDYGARFYDPIIGRWGHIDPKAELYFQITPYAYAANTPNNAIDPDGHLVIFIAGMNLGDGNTSGYWRTKSFSFDQAVMNHFHDHSEYYDGGAVYLDGANGGATGIFQTGSNVDFESRFNAGAQHEGVDIGELIMSLKRTKGVITESIKVVAHSMGAAYAKALIGEIEIYAENHPEECEGLSITEYDFAAFQQNELWAVPGTTLYQFDNKGDNVVGGLVGWLNNSHHAKEENAETEGSNSNVNPKGGHSIMDFKAAISTLKPGKYKFVKGKFVEVQKRNKKNVPAK